MKVDRDGCDGQGTEAEDEHGGRRQTAAVGGAEVIASAPADQSQGEAVLGAAAHRSLGHRQYVHLLEAREAGGDQGSVAEQAAEQEHRP